MRRSEQTPLLAAACRVCVHLPAHHCPWLLALTGGGLWRRPDPPPLLLPQAAHLRWVLLLLLLLLLLCELALAPMCPSSFHVPQLKYWTVEWHAALQHRAPDVTCLCSGLPARESSSWPPALPRRAPLRAAAAAAPCLGPQLSAAPRRPPHRHCLQSTMHVLMW